MWETTESTISTKRPEVELASLCGLWKHGEPALFRG